MPTHKIKYALSNAPQGDPDDANWCESAARAGPLNAVSRKTNPNSGLDHYEHRSWTAWHRHMRLVFLAQLFLLRLQIKFKKNSRVDPAASPLAHGVQFSRTQTSTGLRSHPCGLPYTTQ